MLVRISWVQGMAKSQLEEIEAALAGRPARLRFVFLSADKNERAGQINEEIRGLPVQGLAVRVFIGTDDAKGQSVPGEAAGKSRSWRESPDVPAGEFHIEISRVQ